MIGLYDRRYLAGFPDDTVIDYIYANDLVPEIIGEEILVTVTIRRYAYDLWEKLREELAVEMARAYIARHDLYEDFLGWRHDKNTG
jgi:hypothetical protein